MSSLPSSLRWGTFAALLLALVVSTSARPAAVSATGNPCEQVNGPAGVPREDPDPLIAGTVTDVMSASGIAGATVNLYRCSGNLGVYVTSATTTSAGQFQFGSLEQAWYYVEAAMTGPLSGKTPATSNPSALIEVGDGNEAVDFAFQ
jgi:hypothetical protein